MSSHEKEQIIEEIRQIYDLKISELQLQIESLTNFTDSLLEYILTNSEDKQKTKNEIKDFYSKKQSKDKVKQYFNNRLDQ